MIKFIKCTAAQYAAATKDENNFYYVDNSRLYLGSKELTTESDITTAVALVNNGTKGNEALYAEISKLEGDAATTGSIASLLAALKTEIEGEVVNSISAGNNGIIIGGTATAPTVGAKLSVKAGNALSIETGAGEEGLYVNVPEGTDYSVTVAETTPQGVAKRYTFTQEGSTIATIDIPKDMVVDEGSVVDITYNSEDGKLYDGATDVTEAIKGEGGTASANDAGKYIKLIIANGDTLYIAAKDLVDIYTAEQNATQVQLAINNNVISATIVAGSIGTTELASSVVTSLNKADSALQAADITTGSTNGTIDVDGTEVAVAGLGSAAYAATTDFDASGSAAAVLGTSTDTASANTVYGAKAYADSLADNYDVAGAAATAKSEVIGSASDAASANTIYGAKAYADELLTWETMSTPSI